MDIKDAILQRRTCYNLSPVSPISDKEIEEILNFVVLNTPSPFNSQSTRLVLLLGAKHTQLWNIVKDCLRKIVPADAFAATEDKINSSFSSGYGTVLFYEDQKVVEGMQQRFASYKDYFPQWSEHTNAMHQFAIWTLLKEAGMGASLQHYNPIINKELCAAFGISPDWRLIAQMPFGTPTQPAGPKQFQDLASRIKVIK